MYLNDPYSQLAIVIFFVGLFLFVWLALWGGAQLSVKIENRQNCNKMETFNWGLGLKFMKPRFG